MTTCEIAPPPTADHDNDNTRIVVLSDAGEPSTEMVQLILTPEVWFLLSDQFFFMAFARACACAWTGVPCCSTCQGGGDVVAVARCFCCPIVAFLGRLSAGVICTILKTNNHTNKQTNKQTQTIFFCLTLLTVRRSRGLSEGIGFGRRGSAACGT